MDESWRMRMGMANLPRRKSTEETLPNRTRQMFTGESESIHSRDFNDVFGGPPRSVLLRNFSGDYIHETTSFYEEIFRKPDPTQAPSRSGRNLPGFRIPSNRESGKGFQRTEGFYSDIFGSDDEVRVPSTSSWNSKSKSRSKSSSVLSSEDLSPLRSMTGDDSGLSTFASKLRPINVPYRWNTSTAIPATHENEKIEEADFPCNSPSYLKKHIMENIHFESFNTSYSGCSRHVTSPESINSHSFRESSIPQMVNTESMMQNQVEQDEEEDEEEITSSYVIEINLDYREANSVDEAITWAKEKYQNGHAPFIKENEKMIVEEVVEKQQSESDVEKEMKLLDEEIRLWSTGKEANIRFLLSTLDQILWENSGWCSTAITDLIETFHVKKAYQKARLCLHPDKLQQRGATFLQKYVAEKAFSILQDAWATFISEDVCTS